MKIEFKPIDMKYQEVQEVTAAFLELNEDHYRYFVRFTAREPINIEDEGMGWQDDVLTCIDNVSLRKNCVCVEKQYQEGFDQWVVFISVLGLAHDNKMYFKEEKEAQEMHVKIKNWILNK